MKLLCEVVGCDQPSMAKSMCQKHYDRARRGRDLHQMSSRQMPFLARFWSRVHKTDGCWEWTGRVNRLGYGTTYFNPELRCALAHRLSFELHSSEPIPEGLCVLHHCDNPRCVRPSHLFLGTRADNTADMVAKGRQPKGDSKPNAKLSSDEVVEIKALLASGVAHKKIAEDYKINRRTVSHISCGRRWAHIQRSFM